MTDTETNINIKEINEKSKLEIEKWAKLSEKYVTELRKYNLICKFCGCALDENTVNTSCEKNTEVKELTDNKTQDGIIGSKRHYFIPLKK